MNLKTIFTTMLIMFSISLMAHQDTIPGDTERIIDKYGGLIVDKFESTVEKVTPMAEDAFSIVVKVKFAEGILGGILLPIISIALWFLFYRHYKSVEEKLEQKGKKYGPYYEDNVTPFLFLIPACAFIMSVFSFITFYDGVLKIIAPKWFAIKEIFDLVF